MFTNTLITIAVVFILCLLIILLSRYKKCRSNELLVVYGTSKDKAAKVIHGGGAFILHVIQGYGYMSLKPLAISITLS
ncbi:MAG: hypothetical protein ACK5LT_03385 [Lachnospirales bacterium]